MQPTTSNRLERQEFFWPELPLAVYREIMAHLRQVEGVNVGLLPVPQDQPFDYKYGQVGGLWIEYPQTLEMSSKQRLEDILNYYQIS